MTDVYTMKRLTCISLALLLAPSLASSDEPNTIYLESLTVIGEGDALQQTTGSADRLDQESLEKDEYDDLHRVLNTVPGVNIRGEDGFGLRPNIGLRGTTTERSQKITLMEDGVLITPAPYSAPAAYYVPMVSRMTGVEVTKGPSAITHGPNTVGGSINLITRPIPYQAEGEIDVASGSHGYQKMHVHYGDSSDQWGWLVEGLHTQATGFKALDTDEDTGFDKNNVMLKGRWNSDLEARQYQQIDIKLNYADETSNETYLGLSDSDFSQTPYRRYAATQNAEMDWEHKQVQINHLIELDEDRSVNTTVYRHRFERSWTKLNQFNTDRSLGEILANPEAGLNNNFMAVLRGEKDSEITAETLLIGTNARQYLSQGIQTELNWRLMQDQIEHELTLGLRLHHDEIQRNHTENGFLMQSGQLLSDGSAESTTTLNDESADALASYIQDRIQIDKLTLVLGLRFESIDYTSKNTLTGQSQSNDNQIALPGVGAYYALSENLGVLAGVHQGFVPTGPGQPKHLDPEESTNYEVGLRYNDAQQQAEAIAFFSDYSNLKGTCTFSAGCVRREGNVFNGGEVFVQGLEASYQREWALSQDVRMPMSIGYTYTDTEFQSDFTSSFPLWGDVQAGDQLAYIPEHKLNASIGLAREHWELALNAHYVSEQSEQAGSGGPLEGSTVPAYTVFDVNAHYYHGEQHTLYAKIDNIADKEYLVSRRPFGARPGKPRSIVGGYKYRF